MNIYNNIIYDIIKTWTYSSYDKQNNLMNRRNLKEHIKQYIRKQMMLKAKFLFKNGK